MFKKYKTRLLPKAEVLLSKVWSLRCPLFLSLLEANIVQFLTTPFENTYVWFNLNELLNYSPKTYMLIDFLESFNPPWYGFNLWNEVQVILFEIDCAIFYTDLHDFFCQFISWTNWVDSGKFMDNYWISWYGWYGKFLWLSHNY